MKDSKSLILGQNVGRLVENTSLLKGSDTVHEILHMDRLCCLEFNIDDGCKKAYMEIREYLI